MSEEKNILVQSRLEKLAELGRAGVRPYADDFAVDTLAREVHERCGAFEAQDMERVKDGPRLSLAGRMLAVRHFGKAAFFHLLDRSGRIQVYVRKDSVDEDGFRILKLLDSGDVVGVEGRPFRTRTGELTIEARRLRLLTKSLRPLPEKWHGLKDIETRYRQRYVDLVVNEPVREVFRRRARIVSAIRAFLDGHDFLEVETPMMQSIPGGAAARPFATHHNALGIDLYLRVAPELHLKRLLVGGLDRVYELGRCFRNEGLSRRHNPEYTMLEFYMAHATYRDLMGLTEKLFLAIAADLGMGCRIPYQGGEIDLAPPWSRLPLHEAVEKALGLSRADLEDAGRLARIAAEREVPVAPGATAGECVLALFEKIVEPTLVQPTFVVDYPVEVSPLARRSHERPGIVERFEVFAGGMELGNAFSELTDPVDQRTRFERQAARGARSEAASGSGAGGRADPVGAPVGGKIDEDFLCAMEHGMPPAAGEGIGVDRLVMLFTDSASIRDVILFPQLRPEA